MNTASATATRLGVVNCSGAFGPSRALTTRRGKARPRLENICMTDTAGAEHSSEFREQVTKLRELYEFGIAEVLTKVTILRREFEHNHDYTPIEHVRQRIKSVDAILEKVERTECEHSIDAVRRNIQDIAGIRVTAPFVSDLYWVA